MKRTWDWELGHLDSSSVRLFPSHGLWRFSQHLLQNLSLQGCSEDQIKWACESTQVCNQEYNKCSIDIDGIWMWFFTSSPVMHLSPSPNSVQIYCLLISTFVDDSSKTQRTRISAQTFPSTLQHCKSNLCLYLLGTLNMFLTHLVSFPPSPDSQRLQKCWFLCKVPGRHSCLE